VTIFFDGFEDGEMSDWTRSSVDATVKSHMPCEGTYHGAAKLGAWFSRTISTAGYTDVHFKYGGRTWGADAGEYLLVEWYDGSSWHTLDQILNNEACVYRDWDMPAGADNNASFAVRFTGSMDKNTEWAYADAVEVTGQ
jgi:hypothetical protein